MRGAFLPSFLPSLALVCHLRASLPSIRFYAYRVVVLGYCVFVCGRNTRRLLVHTRRSSWCCSSTAALALAAALRVISSSSTLGVWLPLIAVAQEPIYLSICLVCIWSSLCLIMADVAHLRQMRVNILTEIYNTELDYVDDLLLMTEVSRTRIFVMSSARPHVVRCSITGVHYSVASVGVRRRVELDLLQHR